MNVWPTVLQALLHWIFQGTGRKGERLNNLPGFRHCAYAECVRILTDAGFAAMTERYPELKSPKPGE